jgi:hypothetical protein
MNEAGFSGTLVPVFQAAHCHILEDHKFAGVVPTMYFFSAYPE